MTKAIEDRWDSRLEAWAEYMLSSERGGKVRISSAYSRVGRGGLEEGDGIPIHVGEALDTDDLYRKLPAALRDAVWAWYVDTGTLGQKAHRLAIHRDTFTDRVKGAKYRLEDMHRARLHVKTKTARPFPQKG